MKLGIPNSREKIMDIEFSGKKNLKATLNARQVWRTRKVQKQYSFSLRQAI
jgi:hypothetical protein